MFPNTFSNVFKVLRSGSRTAATPKKERFGIIVNGWKRYILDVAAVLDPPLVLVQIKLHIPTASIAFLSLAI